MRRISSMPCWSLEKHQSRATPSSITSCFAGTERFTRFLPSRWTVPDLLKDGKTERAGFTRYFGRSSLFSVTPITEEAVRELLPHIDGRPAKPLSFSRGEWEE